MVKKYKAMNVSDSTDEGNKRTLRGTARIDTARKILENEWFNTVIRDRRLTDDYKRDLANDFGKNEDVDAEYLIEQIDDVKPKRVWVEKKESDRQVLVFYWSFMQYTVEIDTSKVRFVFED